MADQHYIVIEILTPEIADLVCDIKPELADRDYETELRYNFLVLGFPRPGETTLVLPNIFNKNFDPQPGGTRVVLHTFVKKVVNNDPLRKTYVVDDE